MDNWNIKENKLTKQFEFRNFTEAIRFINSVAEIANRHNHHPDIFLHAYKLVDVTSVTHSAGAITEKDYALAKEIDILVKK